MHRTRGEAHDPIERFAEAKMLEPFLKSEAWNRRIRLCIDIILASAIIILAIQVVTLKFRVEKLEERINIEIPSTEDER